MIVKLKRYSYADTETEGILSVGDVEFATLELPWIPDGGRGGTPFISCIPDGRYRLEPYTRPSGEEAYIVWNVALGVGKFTGHRTYILIHVGNWTTDIEGCILPGLQRYPRTNPKTGVVEQAVAESGAAMDDIRRLLGKSQHILDIRSVTGAKDE